MSGAASPVHAAGVGRRTFCAAIAGAAAGSVCAAPGSRGVGGLVVAYHVLPAQRARLRDALSRGAAARLAQWRADGLIAGSRVLFNRHADTDVWDAMLLIEFPPGGAGMRWESAEREFPGALDTADLSIVSAMHTVPVELARRRQDEKAASRPVVLAIPYRALVPQGEYMAYADGYAIPQFDGWMREGILSGYSLWAASYAASRPWTHLLLLDYRGDDALAARDRVVAKVREELKSVPRWRAISESKANVREERQPVVADEVGAAGR